MATFSLKRNVVRLERHVAASMPPDPSPELLRRADEIVARWKDKPWQSFLPHVFDRRKDRDPDGPTCIEATYVESVTGRLSAEDAQLFIDECKKRGYAW